MFNFIKLLPVLAHQIIFLAAQIFILLVCGVGYSGSLAYIGATSSVIAVLICLRWDTEILVNKSQPLSESMLDATMTIIFMTIIILFINAIVGSPLENYIIWSAVAVAFHELFVSILFVQNKIYVYSLFRSIPAIALIFLALLQVGSEFIWLTAFLLSSFMLAFYFTAMIREAISDISLQRIRKIKIKSKFSAAITSSLFTFFSAFFIIIINFQFGNEYAGLWSNSIRIFNSAIIFLLAAILPFMLNKIGDQIFDSEKVKTFIFLWLLFLPLIIVSFLVVLNYGNLVLSLFIPLKFNVSNINLSFIFLISVALSFVGSAQGLYQSLNKSITLLYIIIFNLLLGSFLAYHAIDTFTSLLEVFLILAALPVCTILVHLMYCLTLIVRD